MKKKVIKWLIVLLFSIIICVLSICGYASLAKKNSCSNWNCGRRVCHTFCSYDGISRNLFSQAPKSITT